MEEMLRNSVDEPHVRPQLRLFPTKKTNSFVGRTRKLMFTKTMLSLKRILNFRYHTLVSCNADWYLPVRNTSKKLWWIRDVKWILRSLSWKHLRKNPMIFSTCSMPQRLVFLQLYVLLWCFLQTQWHDLEINTYGTLVGWLVGTTRLKNMNQNGISPK